MGLIRKIMQDRSSAGAVAMLALLLFLLQGLANGAASGSMTALLLATDDIICSTHAPEGTTGKHDPAGKLANNCCGTLCRLAAASATALPVTAAELAGATIPEMETAFLPPRIERPSTPPNRDSQPRAPPLSAS